MFFRISGTFAHSPDSLWVVAVLLHAAHRMGSRQAKKANFFMVFNINNVCGKNTCFFCKINAAVLY